MGIKVSQNRKSKSSGTSAGKTTKTASIRARVGTGTPAPGAAVVIADDDRRTHKRTPYTKQVRIETPDGAVYDAEAENLSEGGMFVKCDFFLPPCTICKIVPVDDNDDFVAEATVVRAGEKGPDFAMGLWFEPLDSGSLDAVKNATKKA